MSARFAFKVTNGLWPQPIKIHRDGEPVGEIRDRTGQVEFTGHTQQAITATFLTIDGWHGMKPLITGTAPNQTLVVPDLETLAAPITKIGVDGRDAPATEVVVGQLPLPRVAELAHYNLWSPSSPATVKIGNKEVGKLDTSGGAIDISGHHCYSLVVNTYSTIAIGFGGDSNQLIEPAPLHAQFKVAVDYIFEEPPAKITIKTGNGAWTERKIYQLQPATCKH